jgi:hypothetical protein
MTEAVKPYNTESITQLTSLLKDDQQAIAAIEKIQPLANQLETLLKQNPPDQNAIINCFNQLATEWNAFLQIPVSAGPLGVIKLTIQTAGLGLQVTGLGIETGDFTDAANSCGTFEQTLGQLITELQNP